MTDKEKLESILIEVKKRADKAGENRDKHPWGNWLYYTHSGAQDALIGIENFILSLSNGGKNDLQNNHQDKNKV